MTRTILFLLFFLPFIGYAQTPAARLDSLISDLSKFEDTLGPSAGRGMIPTGEYPLQTIADYQQSGESYQAFQDLLNSIPVDSLDTDHSITWHLLSLKLQNEIDEINFRRYLVPLNAEGGFYNSFRYARNSSGIQTLEHFKDYLTYLDNFTEWMESRQELMEEGIRQGIVAPRPVIRNTQLLLKSWMPEEAADSPYYIPFKSSSLSGPEMDSLKSVAKNLIENRINPFYVSFSQFLSGEYLAASPEKPGVMFQSDGPAFYESRMRYFTTYPMSADSVHQLGLCEVERIRARMDAIIDSLEFQGSFAEFLTFLRTDPQFYAETPEELLHRAAWLSKRAEAGLPRLFKKLYSLPFTVEPVPDHIAPTYTGGRYVPGSWYGRRAGIYWVNTYKLESRPFYTLPALTLHEAVPGHHLQIMLSAELDLSAFRRNYYISAFGEGWGLYSEFLGEEMGMYETPYDMFGRLTYEMWRACRLVVDTGIHAYGWTREEAVEYMQSNTALSLHEVNTEIDRYIGWPGQAVSYKVGELKIKALREKAEKQLGSDFDVREYHEVVLGNGSVTLAILEELVDAWITEKKQVVSNTH